MKITLTLSLLVCLFAFLAPAAPAQSSGGTGEFLVVTPMVPMGKGERKLREQVMKYTERFRTNPTSWPLLANRATTLKRLGNYLKDAEYYQQAADAYTQLIEMDAERASGWRQDRAECYFKLKQYDAAIADLTTALANPEYQNHKPSIARILGRRARAYYKKGQIARAMEDIKEAIAADEKEDMAYRVRGAINIGAGRTEEGIRDLTHAATLAVDVGMSRELYEARIKAGELDEAVVDIDRRLNRKQYVAAPEFRGLRADVFLRQKNYKLAVDDATAVIVVGDDPGELQELSSLADAYRVRAEANCALGNRPAALEDEQQAAAFGGKVLRPCRSGVKR